MSGMSVIQKGSNRVLIDIPAPQAVRRLEQAVRAATHVELAAKGLADGMSLRGRFAASTAEAVVVRLEHKDDPRPEPSTYCDATFKMSGEEFLFTSVVLGVSQVPGGVDVELSYPDCIQMWQRRRFLRAAIADSTTVWLGAPGDAGAGSAEGRLLNLSQEGLACRMQVAAADTCAIGDRVGLAFELNSAGSPFRFEGTVISKTAGGTPGTIIVGVHFDMDQCACSERERLARALHAFM